MISSTITYTKITSTLSLGAYVAPPEPTSVTADSTDVTADNTTITADQE